MSNTVWYFRRTAPGEFEAMVARSVALGDGKVKPDADGSCDTSKSSSRWRSTPPCGLSARPTASGLRTMTAHETRNTPPR